MRTGILLYVLWATSTRYLLQHTTTSTFVAEREQNLPHYLKSDKSSLAATIVISNNVSSDSEQVMMISARFQIYPQLLG